jgi:hypothetical protein
VQQKTPFLTGFSTHLFGSAKGKTQDILSRQRHHLITGTLDLQQQFLQEIDPHLLARHSSTQRTRHYPDRLIFWAFFSQVVSDDGSCAAAVAHIQAWAQQRGLPVPAGSTSSYCEARAKLPVEMLRAVNDSLYKQLDAELGTERLWRGLRPRVEDGTSVQAPDTEANRQAYPYPPGQKEGCGFPMIKLNGLIDLTHGGLREFATSSVKTSELSNHNKLEDNYLQKGDVFIADRLYGGFEFIQRLSSKGIHFISRAHQARKIDFRQGRKLGPNERLVTWTKPRQLPPGSRLTKAQWEAVPEQLQVRIIRTKGPDRDGKQKTRYIVTTLLDSKAYPADEVASLYMHRWEIEVRFRDIKTTLGMELLRTRTPGMVEKELLMHQIVYNLMRLVMLKAGKAHGINHRRLSFRGAQQVIGAFINNFKGLASRPTKSRGLRHNVWMLIAERLVKERPGRNEPRRVKRRPKCTRWLQKPRDQYFEHFRSETPPPKILDNPA